MPRLPFFLLLALALCACDDTDQGSAAQSPTPEEPPIEVPSCDPSDPGPMRTIARQINLARFGPCGHLAYRNLDLTLSITNPALEDPTEIDTDVISFTFSPSGQRLAYMVDSGLGAFISVHDLDSGESQQLGLEAVDSTSTYGFLVSRTDPNGEKPFFCTGGVLSVVNEGQIVPLGDLGSCRSIFAAKAGPYLAAVDDQNRLVTFDADASASHTLGSLQQSTDDTFHSHIFSLSTDGQVLLHARQTSSNCAEICDETLRWTLYRMPQATQLATGDVREQVNPGFTFTAGPDHRSLLTLHNRTLFIDAAFAIHEYPDTEAHHLFSQGTHALMQNDEGVIMMDLTTNTSTRLFGRPRGKPVASEDSGQLTTAAISDTTLQVHIAGQPLDPVELPSRSELRHVWPDGSALLYGERGDNPETPLYLLSPSGEHLADLGGDASATIHTTPDRLVIVWRYPSNAPEGLANLRPVDVIDPRTGQATRLADHSGFSLNVMDDGRAAILAIDPENPGATDLLMAGELP